jgi:hypothetical protein
MMQSSTATLRLRPDIFGRHLLNGMGLELHPDKTKVVYCQDANRRGNSEHTSFDFLGYTFRGRLAKGRQGFFAAGVFEALEEEALRAYDKVIGLDLSEVAVDGSLQKSPCGGEGTGKNPTDRAKLGWKWSILTERNGIPIGWAVDGANRNDSVMLEPTLDNAAARGGTCQAI